MAVAFDAKAGTAGSVDNNSGTLSSLTFTVSASATLVIGIFTSTATSTNTPATPSSASFNSVAMTLIGNKTSTDGLSNVYVYAIVNPSTGALLSGSVTYSGGVGAANTVTNDFDCFSFTGTETSSVANCIPSANVINDASNCSTTAYPSSPFSVTTANGDAACAGMNQGVEAGAIAMTSGNGTVINSERAQNVNYCSGYHLASGATTTLQFDMTPGGVAGACSGVAFRIKQPGGGDVLASQIWI